jgi:DNA polymerase-1
MDASAFIHRAFHAMGNLTAPDGQPTGAIFGYVNSLFKLIKDRQPQALAVVFDSRGKGRRHALYPQYKENRPPMDPDLASQQEPIREITKALGLFSLETPGFEADDIIASLAQDLTANGHQVVIVSGDKDFYQLLSDKISMYDPSPKKDSALTAEAFRERFDLEPPAFLQMQALMGDSSDNIPGVPKIGIVNAQKLIKQFGTIDNLYQNLNEIKSKSAQENLAAHEAEARISLELARLGAPDTPKIAIEDLKPQPPDLTTLNALFKKLDFNRFNAEIKRLYGESSLFDPKGPSAVDSSSPKEPAPMGEVTGEVTSGIDYASYVLVNPHSLSDLLEKLAQAKSLALDLKTDNQPPLNASIVGLSLALGPNQAYYLPFQARDLTSEARLDLNETLEKLTPLLTDSTKALMAHNAKAAWLTLAQRGVNLPAPQGDPALAAYLLNPVNQNGLSHLSLKLLGIQPLDLAPYIDLKKASFGDLDVATALKSSAESADLTYRLAVKCGFDLAKNPPLLALYQKVELPLTELLARLEKRGILIDQKALLTLSEEFGREIAARERKIQALAGQLFNVASTKALEKVLFTDLGLKVGKKTAKKTAYSTDSEVLRELMAGPNPHPILPEILAFREISKLKNTYADKLPNFADANGRVHTTFNQTQTATGRLSSSEPNLQNIPTRSEEGKKFRACFVAENGQVLVGADYSQIELRIMAHFSQDHALLAAFANHEDVHAQTAARIFGVPLNEVTSTQRRQAKAINFGVIFGQGAFGLAKKLEISRTAASSIIDDYFQRFSGVKNYMDKVILEAKKTGHLTTWFGRPRPLEAINALGTQARRGAERIAINTPIQGTAADIIKMAMIEVDRELQKRGLKAQLLLQVHDELVVEAPEEEAAEVKTILAATMVKAAREPLVPWPPQGPITVAMEVDVSAGPSWASA